MTRIRAMEWGGLAAGVTFGITVLVVLALAQGQTKPAPVTAAVPAVPVLAAPASPADNLRMTNDVRVYEAVKDAVVNIVSSRLMTVRVGSGNDLFDRMMPQALPMAQVQRQSLGSGFVIHPAGYIVTNEHVVEEATDVQCVFFNGDKLSAQVIATDNEHDLAVLKVVPLPGKPLKAMILGSSEDLLIGEPVYAIGNPLGYAGTMTRGIISAVDRTLDLSPTKSYKGLIQTDASINPGNSGGPLLNCLWAGDRGEHGDPGGCAGDRVCDRGIQHAGFAAGVFECPGAESARWGSRWRRNGRAKPPASVTAEVVVKQVQAGSAAEKQGLKAGDVVVTVGGVTPANVVDALVALATAKPGDDLGMQVLRGQGGDAKKVDLVIPVTKAPPSAVEELLLTKMGIKGQTVTPALMAKLKLSVNEGVYIDTVEPDSPAAKCGMQVGMCCCSWECITCIRRTMWRRC